MFSRGKLNSVLALMVTLAIMIVLAAPVPVSALSSPSAVSDNIEVLRTEHKVIDGKMKVTADVRVESGEKVSLLVIGHDKSGNIIEMKRASTHIFGGNTHVFQLTMDNGEQLHKVDIQAHGATEEPYKIIAQTMITHKDHVEALIAIKSGPVSQKMNVVAKGLNKNGKVVEIRGTGNHAFDQSINIYSIKLEAVHDIAKVQFLILTDDQTYLVDYGTYIKNGQLVVTSVIKNGTKSQQMMSKVTPYDAKGKELNIQTSSSHAFDHSVHNLRMTIKDKSANRVDLKYYDETGKNEIKKRDSIMVTIDGQGLAVKQPPVKKDGSVSVPMRDIFEALGANIDWDKDTRTVTATRGSKEVILTIGSKHAYIDSEKVTLSVAPTIMNGSTMVPVRFVSEALGSKVFWDNDSQTVLIVR